MKKVINTMRTKADSLQMDMFAQIADVYQAAGEPIVNDALYAALAEMGEIDAKEIGKREPIGESGALHSPVKRRVRWYQQTMKQAGILEKVEGSRGFWRLTEKSSKDLSRIGVGIAVIGFSTTLGIAILGSCDTVFSSIDSPITLSIMSPPYPLAQARSYGNVSQEQYVDWICKMIGPVVKNLVRGGSICLNISNDIFVSKSPARSMYIERLILALHDRLGLHLMDRLVWQNKTKAPGPIQWASLKRVQLNVGYEPIYWMTNDPAHVKSDNRRVLQAHTEQHLKLIAQGGEQRARSNSDGAYRVMTGAYGNQTAGKIARNVLSHVHACANQQDYKRMARRDGLPVHGATMPLSLASFLIEFMSAPGDLVVDPFGGSFTTALAAERLGRRWMSTECMAEYVLGAANRFREFAGFDQAMTA
ncbi:MAG: DNA modification methylase [Flavobacteriaceae bacterium]|jgi:DNA modification methylase